MSAEGGGARATTSDGRHPQIVDSPFKNDMPAAEKRVAGHAFHLVERVLLILVAAMTLGGVASELTTVWGAKTITLGDILLMFLYIEVMGMVAVFYTGRASIFVYPIFIAITALARLIILQGKDMAPENIVFEASAILLLTFAAVIIVRVGRA